MLIFYYLAKKFNELFSIIEPAFPEHLLSVL